MSVRQFYVILNLLTTGNVILHGFSNSVEEESNSFKQAFRFIFLSLPFFFFQPGTCLYNEEEKMARDYHTCVIFVRKSER